VVTLVASLVTVAVDGQYELMYRSVSVEVGTGG
jgi:hypothetical protein